MTETKREKPEILPFNGRKAAKITPIALIDYYMKGNSLDQKSAKIELLRRLTNYWILLDERREES